MQHDTKEFRAALGAFATGVTIMTTSNADGGPIGMTASSFNTVSLNPPLVMWALGKESRSLVAFQSARGFAVHVLSAGQKDLSNRFASDIDAKFKDIPFTVSALGNPLLETFAARFDCKTIHQYEGGDHIIFVGEVSAFVSVDVAPLLFHRGSYAGVQLAS